MMKIQITDNFFLYTFTGEKELNIPILLNEGKAILIDTGYPEQAQELKEFFASEGIQPEIVIHSHYHPDHFLGNQVFAGCKFMGSEKYKENFELFEALNPEGDYIKPSSALRDGSIMEYGTFQLKFLQLPGHSKDSIVTIINQNIAHVGDLLMLTNAGLHTVPYISFDGSVDDHIESLETIEQLPITTLIPAHGTIINGKENISQAIHSRINYLQKLKSLGKDSKVEDCLGEELAKYTLLGLHEKNLKNIYR